MHQHNFIHDTKLKWSPEDRLWIDKVRCLFWWWMNIYLENEASPLYGELVKVVEAMSTEEWLNPETERRMWDLDDALSNVLKARGIRHYTISFKDRPEIPGTADAVARRTRRTLDDSSWRRTQRRNVSGGRQ